MNQYSNSTGTRLTFDFWLITRWCLITYLDMLFECMKALNNYILPDNIEYLIRNLSLWMPEFDTICEWVSCGYFLLSQVKQNYCVLKDMIQCYSVDSCTRGREMSILITNCKGYKTSAVM